MSLLLDKDEDTNHKQLFLNLLFLERCLCEESHKFILHNIYHLLYLPHHLNGYLN